MHEHVRTGGDHCIHVRQGRGKDCLEASNALLNSMMQHTTKHLPSILLLLFPPPPLPLPPLTIIIMMMITAVLKVTITTMITLRTITIK